MKKLIFAGIGSRETPKEIIDEMIKFGEWVRKNSHTLRSGHANGADWAFEEGAQERCIAYLPWYGFNAELKSNSMKIVVSNQANYNQITDDYHHNPHRLSSAGRKLMNRNSCQVLGLSLQKHTDLVICWTKDGGPSGGTGQAIRIAQGHGIPVYNMFYEKYNTADKLIQEIVQNF